MVIIFFIYYLTLTEEKLLQMEPQASGQVTTFLYLRKTINEAKKELEAHIGCLKREMPPTS